MSGKKKDIRVYNAGFAGEEQKHRPAAKTVPVRRTQIDGIPPRKTESTAVRKINVKNAPPARNTDASVPHKGQRPRAVRNAKMNNAPKGENIKNALRVQSPAARKAGRQEKKITGSAKNIEVKRRAHREKRTFKIKKKKNSLRYFMFRTILFILEFAVIAGVFTAVFAVKLRSDTDNSKEMISVNVGAKEDPAHYTYTSNCSRIDSVYYVCADDLMKLCSLTVTGTKDHLHYISPVDGEYVEFDIGTRNAVVNGTEVKLESACFSKGGRLFVPYSFFADYATGVTFKAEKDEITLERKETGKDVNGTRTYEGFGFVLKPHETIVPINEDDVKGDTFFADNG